MTATIDHLRAYLPDVGASSQDEQEASGSGSRERDLHLRHFNHEASRDN